MQAAWTRSRVTDVAGGLAVGRRQRTAAQTRRTGHRPQIAEVQLPALITMVCPGCLRGKRAACHAPTSRFRAPSLRRSKIVRRERRDEYWARSWWLGVSRPAPNQVAELRPYLRIAGCRSSKARTRRQSPSGKRTSLASHTLPIQFGGVMRGSPVRTLTGTCL